MVKIPHIKKPTLHIMETIENKMLDATNVTENTAYINCTININASHVKIQDVLFKNCDFSNQEFMKLDVLDVIFDHCNFANSKFNEAMIYRTEFNNCQLVGVQYMITTCKDVIWNNCNLSLSIFSEVRIENAYFQDSIMKQAFIHFVKWKNIKLTETNIDNADFSLTYLKDFDISDCNFDVIHFNPAYAKKMIIDYSQAYKIISAFGIIIK